MKDNNSKQVLLSVLGVAILVVAVVGVSFAAFTFSQTGVKENVITTGTINMSYSEPENGITLTDAVPMDDATGKALSGAGNTFDFTVSATIDGSGQTTINYAITAVTTPDKVLTDEYVKVYLTNSSDTATTNFTGGAKKVSALTKTSSDASGAPDGQFILESGTFDASRTDQYKLRMWVASDYPIDQQNVDPDGEGVQEAPGGQTYTLRVNVYGAAAAQ